MNEKIRLSPISLSPKLEKEQKLLSVVLFLFEVTYTWVKEELPEVVRSWDSHNSKLVAQQHGSDGGEAITGSLDINNSDDPPHRLSGMVCQILESENNLYGVGR
jgi:hypothetical protein